MRKAIKYVLAYFAILNFVAPMCVAAVYALYGYYAHGVFSFNLISPQTLLPAELTGMIMMLIYLYADGALGIGSKRVRPTSMVFAYGAWISCYWLVSVAMRFMKWLPDIMEQTFDNLLSDWLGILLIVLVGPVTEELIFRKAVTDSLLEHYSPAKSIIISALIFGLFHINPAQIVPAFFLGLLFAWIYLRTGSLIPTMMLHITSNGFSSFLLTRESRIDDITEITPAIPMAILTVVAAIMLVFSLYFLALDTRAKK